VKPDYVPVVDPQDEFDMALAGFPQFIHLFFRLGESTLADTACTILQCVGTTTHIMFVALCDDHIHV
jgi:hypothetical protein